MNSDSTIESTADVDQAAALVARQYFSGFELAHDTYNALSVASDGKIYYVLSSESLEHAAQFYCYDPDEDTISHLGDLSAMCGEKDARAIPQGKSHVEFYEYQGKLFFATHVGFYEMIDGMERLPVNAPAGYTLYKGGHILSYDLASGEVSDLAIIPDGEGVLTMVMDQERGDIYCISWPTGLFLHYDPASGTMRNLGPVSARGEAGIPGTDYRVLCRSMFIDPRDGTVYYSTAEGDIMAYRRDNNIRKVEAGSLYDELVVNDSLCKNN